MANTIRIKRRAAGGASGAPSSMANGELAYNEQDNTLYYGYGTGGVGGTATSTPAIGGSGAFATLGTAQTISGNKTFTGSVDLTGATVTAPTQATGDNSIMVATTAFVKSLGYNSGTVTSVALSLPAIFTVSGSPVTTTGTLSATFASQTANTHFCAPDGSSGTPTFRALTANDIPSLTSSKISDLATTVQAYKLSQFAAPNASVSFGSQNITNLADPVNAQDAATKNYVDATAQGLDPKGSVKAATTANITLSGTQTIDGIALVAGDRCLVKNQTTTSQNGIYVVSASTWTRALDMDAWSEVPGAFTFVEQGSTLADTGWVCTSDQGGTIGTTAITFTQFSGAGTYTAGNGLSLSGGSFSVTGTTNRISVSGSGVDIAATYVGQSSITTLGTIGTGVWNGSTIGVAYGGTGATTLTGYVKGSGTSAFTASSTIPNTDITGLGTMSTQAASNVAITGGSITNLTTFDGISIDGGSY